MKHSLSNRLLFLTVTATLLALPLRAESEPDIPWGKLQDTANRYLEACSTPKDVASMTKKLRQRVQQRTQDSETLSEDSIMRALMIDWAASNIGKIKRKERETVTQACFYFVTFIDKGFLVPQQIRMQLTPETQKEIFDHLEGEIAKAKEKKPAAN